MQTPGNQGLNDLQSLTRQIERLEERLEARTKDLATRTDLEGLRREVVARDLLEPQLRLLTSQIVRLETDRLALEKRVDELEADQASRSEKFWMKMGPAVAAIALLISIVEFLTHVRLAP